MTYLQLHLFNDRGEDAGTYQCFNCGSTRFDRDVVVVGTWDTQYRCSGCESYNALLNDRHRRVITRRFERPPYIPRLSETDEIVGAVEEWLATPKPLRDRHESAPGDHASEQPELPREPQPEVKSPRPDVRIHKAAWEVINALPEALRQQVLDYLWSHVDSLNDAAKPYISRVDAPPPGVIDFGAFVSGFSMSFGPVQLTDDQVEMFRRMFLWGGDDAAAPGDQEAAPPDDDPDGGDK